MESLFVYGTLGPGRPNAHVLEDIGGQFEAGHVGGSLLNKGWGAEMGFPGIVLDDSGNRVDGFIFFSENLTANWHILDDFEGEGYERVPVDVVTQDGRTHQSCIYRLKA